MNDELICPICDRPWSGYGCPHDSFDYIPLLISAREHAGKMYRRALKAERELAELKAKTEETVERR